MYMCKFLCRISVCVMLLTALEMRWKVDGIFFPVLPIDDKLLNSDSVFSKQIVLTAQIMSSVVIIPFPGLLVYRRTD